MPGRKRCNQLDGKTWTRYSISVWSDLRKETAEIKLKHPASFPLEMARRCIEIFTAGDGELVLDPFAGSGTTLMAAWELGRWGIGLELYPEYVELFNRRFQQEAAAPAQETRPPGGKRGTGLAEVPREKNREKNLFDQPVGGSICQKPRMILDDARNMQLYLQPGEVDLVLTSPPYWDIMQSRRSADRKEPRPYGESAQDLGRLEGYRVYLQQLCQIFKQVYRVLKNGGYCLVVVMDLRKRNRFYPLHLDLTYHLERLGFALDDIIIWDRRHEYNRLRPLGYPAVFRVNKVHEYLLIFKKEPTG